MAWPSLVVSTMNSTQTRSYMDSTQTRSGLFSTTDNTHTHDGMFSTIDSNYSSPPSLFQSGENVNQGHQVESKNRRFGAFQGHD
jgi:hypothetical protein